MTFPTERKIKKSKFQTTSQICFNHQDLEELYSNFHHLTFHLRPCWNSPQFHGFAQGTPVRAWIFHRENSSHPRYLVNSQLKHPFLVGISGFPLVFPDFKMDFPMTSRLTSPAQRPKKPTFDVPQRSGRFEALADLRGRQVPLDQVEVLHQKHGR